MLALQRTFLIYNITRPAVQSQPLFVRLNNISTCNYV